MRLLAIFSILISFCIVFAAQGAVIRSEDNVNKCTQFSILNVEKLDDGNYGLPRQLGLNEHIVSHKDLYYFSLEKIDIDFKNDQVEGGIRMHVVAGFNRFLMERQKITIDANNPDLNKILNKGFKEICLDGENNLIYARHFEMK